MPAVRQFDPDVDYYAILNVPVTASKDEITRSYRAMMRKNHPDNFTDPVTRDLAEETAKTINVAYTVLSQPGVRREYDRVVRSNVMADTVRQRYTNGVSPPPRPAGQRRDPSQRVRSRTVEMQRSDLWHGVRQLAVTFGGVALLIIGVIILFMLAGAGFQLLFP